MDAGFASHGFSAGEKIRGEETGNENECLTPMPLNP